MPRPVTSGCLKGFTVAELTRPGRSAAALSDTRYSATANPDRTIFPGRWHEAHAGGKGPARDVPTRTAMKWLRECLAEYARHPLPTFIGAAIIGASLIMAAMVFITRQPVSEPSAPLAGSAQSVTPGAPSTRAPRASRPPERPSSAPAAQPQTAAPQIRAAVRRHPRAQDRKHPHPQQRRKNHGH
jgi:hypothetical protein